jgi:hypothetical protein
MSNSHTNKRRRKLTIVLFIALAVFGTGYFAVTRVFDQILVTAPLARLTSNPGSKCWSC